MIDAHVHLFPDEAAGRAWQEVAGFRPVRPGTAEDYTARMDRAGVRGAVLLLFARGGRRFRSLSEADGETRDETQLRGQVRGEIQTLNRWGCELASRDGRFLPFVGVDPAFMDADSLVAEVVDGARAGASGVKLVPPDMGRYPDDAALDPVYRACTRLGLPVLSQSGSGGPVAPGSRGPYGHPSGWSAVMGRHPDLRLILAHFGRGHADALISLAERHRGVHTDLSLTLGHPHDAGPPDPARIRSMIRRIGAERVLFGTNYPICDPIDYRARLEELDLTPGERALITEENIRRLTER